ncbi:thiamine phosphate synthase [Chromobacterium violaceum]|uniref:thiamine phosphate synthase n=1 Tax=Chromobacterium violaceum TaxID=536 RepID=UPI0009DA58CC|nr:thiamine phosphate synthase [Chromobacterium violaceum]OQS46486.1 thiamine-phosphate diphosphorylase [Chromobacterium violaceum]OQS49024.1 thiamine-phosphate diphosphorylase [Chromobacterium violaceum]QRO31805.1 thiamine phosphate synthase [Chromobacterium violaceum]QRQ18395.1 thiamine phosphate synthase [Chromobacterium violaceum]
MPPRVEGLYAVTPDGLDDARLFALAAAALAGGARALQYRDKSGDAGRRLRQVAELQRLCRAHGALFIVNDDVELAERIGADGVHLGRDDGDIAAARVRLGADAVIGASCYDRVELARAALAAGASYVAFGAVFSSRTKPHAAAAPLSLFADAAALGANAVAIGGITAGNAGRAVEAGADAIAVIGSLFDADDTAAAARALAGWFGAR